MRAIILAAGRGTRLSPIELVVPKPMVRIAGRPVLEYTIEQMDAQGIRDITIHVGHLKEVITDYFGDGRKFGVRITYSVEGENDNLGTAGGVRAATARWAHSEEPFLVWHGDNFSTCRFDRLSDSHCSGNRDVTITVIWRPDVSHSGVVAWDADKRVVRFEEKPRPVWAGGWVNCGIYLMDPSLISELPEQGDFGRDVFPKLVQHNRAIHVHGLSYDETFRWYDTPEDLAALRKDYK